MTWGGVSVMAGKPAKKHIHTKHCPKGVPNLFSVQVVNWPQAVHHHQSQGPGRAYT